MLSVRGEGLLPGVGPILLAPGHSRAPASCPEKLVIGLLPGESAPTVMRLNEPLRAHLEKALGRPVELVVGANYAATGEAFASAASTSRTLGR